MIRIKKDINNLLVFSLILLTLLILPISSGLIHNLVWIIIVSINSYFMILLFLKFRNENEGKMVKLNFLYFSIALYLLWQLLLLFYHLHGFLAFVKSYAIITTLIVFKDFKINNFNKYIIKFIPILFVISWGLFFLMNPSLGKGFKAYFKNPNLLGLFTLNILTLILFCEYRIKILEYFFVLITIGFLIITKSRTSYLQFIVLISGLVFYRFLGKTAINKKTLSQVTRLLFFGFISLIILFTLLYPLMGDMEIGKVIDEFSKSLFGKSFFSGRNRLWARAIDLIVNNPIMGYGLGVKLSHFVDIKLSMHNLYLEILMQQGIIGLVLLINLIYQIVINIIDNKSARQSILVIVFIFSVIIREAFEVTLTHNLLIVGILVWVLGGMGLNNLSEEVMINGK